MRALSALLLCLAACAPEPFEVPEVDDAELDRRINLRMEITDVEEGGYGTVFLTGGASNRVARLAIAPPGTVSCTAPGAGCLNLALSDASGAPCATNNRGNATCYLPWPYGIQPGSMARAFQPSVARAVSNVVTLVVPYCGDGVVSANEQCDDGNTWDYDGCSAFCSVEYAQCGNGMVEVGEECDDGNTYDGDGCSSACMWAYYAVCGNGVLEPYEECDDGNNWDYDGCNQYCWVEAYSCGDGYVQGGEECDDGNTQDGDGCSSGCMWGEVWSCGNGVVEGWEQCDDGNYDYYDGCDPYCNYE